MKIQKIQMILAVLCIAVACACYGYGRYRDSDRESVDLTVQTESEEKTTALSGISESGTFEPEETSMADQETRPPCYVHICGAVKTPGVYELAAESRVFTAVEAAGGLTEDAAEDYLNLAEIVSDGMKIVVPSKQEIEEAVAAGRIVSGAPGIVTADGSPAGKQDKKINLNSASEEELMNLRGIGQARAEDIIRYREEHGGFTKIEDIMKISGIKEAAFSKIKDDITV